MATVDQIIDRSIALGDLKAAQSEAYGGQAVNLASGYSNIIKPAVENTPRIDEPNVFIPSRAAGADRATVEPTYDRRMAHFTDAYADCIVRYFPLNPALMQAVENWLQSAIAGGTGIDANVERAIWQRDRDRITNEFQAAADEAVGSWAARG